LKRIEKGRLLQLLVRKTVAKDNHSRFRYRTRDASPKLTETTVLAGRELRLVPRMACAQRREAVAMVTLAEPLWSGGNAWIRKNGPSAAAHPRT